MSYDIEISGIDRPEKRKLICNFIAVWQGSRVGRCFEGGHTVEYIHGIGSLEQLKIALEQLVEKYDNTKQTNKHRRGK